MRERNSQRPPCSIYCRRSMISAIHTDPLSSVTELGQPQFIRRIIADLRQWFGVEMSLVDAQTGQWLHIGQDQPHQHADWLASTSREAAQSGQVEFVFDEDPCVALAVPLAPTAGRHLVALGT